MASRSRRTFWKQAGVGGIALGLARNVRADAANGPQITRTTAHRSVALVHLANIALRTGRALDFDPQSERIVDDEAANNLLQRTYRQEGHWAIPRGA
jgi:hypothetical protein